MTTQAQDDALPRPRRAGARVLVVEDDDEMRDLIAATLRRDGYDVDEAASGFEAVHIIETTTIREWSSRAIDLVLSDVCMPGMTGLRLGDMLREARWDMPLIFITSFPDADLTEHAEQIGATVVAKPFRLDLLRRTVLTTIAAHVRNVRAKRDGPLQ